MSFYIGKDNDGNAQLHITDSIVSEQEIRTTTPLPTTLFNSSSSIALLKLFKSVSVAEWLDSAGKVQVPHKVVLLDSATRNELYNGGSRKLFFVIQDGMVYRSTLGFRAVGNGVMGNIMFHKFQGTPSSNDSNGAAWGTNSIQADSTNMRLITNSLSPVTIAVYNFEMATGNTLPAFTSTTSGIVIDNTGFSIRGNDFSKYLFIVSSVLNTRDTTISYNGVKHQIINSGVTSTTLSIETSPINIKLGGHSVIKTGTPYKTFDLLNIYSGTLAPTTNTSGWITLFSYSTAYRAGLVVINGETSIDVEIGSSAIYSIGSDYIQPEACGNGNGGPPCRVYDAAFRLNNGLFQVSVLNHGDCASFDVTLSGVFKLYIFS